MHTSLETDGLLIATIRPRAFLEIRAADLATLPADAIEGLLADYDSGKYVYHPYNLPAIEGEVPYGEAIIPLAYIEQHWTDRFEILEQAICESDPYQLLAGDAPEMTSCPRLLPFRSPWTGRTS